MDLYVIYENPMDYPGKFVVRKWRVSGLGSIEAVVGPFAVVDTLKQARASLASFHLVRMGATPGDDPVIKEVWL